MISIRRIGEHYLSVVGRLQDASAHSDHFTVWIENSVRIFRQRVDATLSKRHSLAPSAPYQ